MRRRTLGLFAALTLVAAAPAASAPADNHRSGQVHEACTSATIVGQHKCIARGQFCKHTKAANRDYHRYGYNCGKRDRNGRYHLT
jgi:uncharacterized membrane protein